MSEYRSSGFGHTEADIQRAFRGVRTVWDLFPPDDGFGAKLIPPVPEGPSSESREIDAFNVNDSNLRDELLGRTALLLSESRELIPA